MAVFDIAFKSYGAKKVFDIMDSMSKSSDDLKENLKETRKESKKFSSIGNSFNKMSNSISDIGENLIKVTGRTNGLGIAMVGIGRSMTNARKNGKGMLGTVGVGFSELFLLLKSGAVTIGGLFAGLGTAMATLLGPIALVIAGLFILKKVWDTNIGGIQTRFSKVLGKMKSSWGKFNAGFIKVLKKVLGPILTGLFDGISTAMKPFITAFSEIGDMFKEVFGDGGDEMEHITTLANVLGGTFKVLGDIISTTFKVAWFFLKPLLKGMLMFHKFTFEMVITPMKKLWEFLKGIINQIPDWALPASLEKLKNSDVSISEASKQTIAGGGSTTNNSKTTNNNQKITVNTSRSASPEQADGFSNMLAKSLSM